MKFVEGLVVEVKDRVSFNYTHGTMQRILARCRVSREKEQIILSHLIENMSLVGRPGTRFRTVIPTGENSGIALILNGPEVGNYVEIINGSSDMFSLTILGMDPDGNY